MMMMMMIGDHSMVFDQMVRSTLHGDTPQYFLVTPKLLPSLDYSSAITVLFILSG
jgi:hypothetical protein